MAIQREQVIATALGLLDEVGIDGLSMRVLADALDIKAASLYWHFANKQALLDGMADALMDDVARHTPAGHPWQQVLSQTAHEIRNALLRRRDGARVFGGSYVPTENVLRVGETMIGALRAAGASTQMAAWGAFSILNYVLGCVMEEQGLAPVNMDEVGLAERNGKLAALAEARFPNVHAALRDVMDTDFDTRFGFGLELWIAGVEARLGAAGV